MNLTMLGTSHGVPSSERYTSCYMLEAGENIYIFDAGAPVIDLLLRRGKDLTKVKALFNSHFHGDHMTGGLGLITLCTWYFKDTKMDIFLPDNIASEAITNYLAAVDNIVVPNERIGFKVYEPGVIFDDGVVKVTAIPTCHFCGEEKKANAFLIEAEGKSILYTGDMGYGDEPDDFPAVAFGRYIDVIISEGAHISVQKLAKWMDKVNTDIFAIVHANEEKFEDFEKLRDKYSFELLIGEDNDEIEL